MIAFIQGLLLGYGYVMPIGAQNLFVIHNALNRNLYDALKVSLIVVVMDISLAIGCFFGAGYLFSTNDIIARLLQILGGIYVIKIGVDLLRSPKVDVKEEKAILGDRKAILRSAFILTWLNPQALIDGSVLLGGIKSSLNGGDSLLFISGVCVASFTWFTGLSAALNISKNRLSANFLMGINLVCGAVLVWFGGKLVFTALKEYL